MASGYDDFLAGLAGEEPKKAPEEKKVAPAPRPAPAPKRPVEQVKRVPKIPVAEERTEKIQFDLDAIEQLEIPEEPHLGVREVKHQTQDIPDYEKMVGYQATDSSQREIWVAIYNKALKARSRSPQVEKMKRGEFIIDKGNVEIMSNLLSKIGPGKSAAEFFNHQWV